ncbi:MAG TPA: response regulator [Roseococcus sp.]|nr:response regulator [Roseococcus sp.]
MSRSPSARALRIAIIEDEALVAFEMEAHLTEAGHEVVGVADTLEDAIRLIEATCPDLALVDIQLAQGSSGLDVAHALHLRGIACLFSTGNCPGLAHDDAVGCLHKPYGQWQLVDAVAAADAIRHGEPPGRVPNEMHIYR